MSLIFLSNDSKNFSDHRFFSFEYFVKLHQKKRPLIYKEINGYFFDMKVATQKV